MEKYSYLLFVLFFSVPSITFLFIRYRKQIQKSSALIPIAILFGIIYALVVDPIGIALGAWAYDTKKSLGFIFGAAIETVLLGIAMCLFFAIFVIVFAEREEKKKSFWQI